MPKAALKPCKYPGCPELVASGYCERHKKERGGAVVRDPNRQRLYGRRWQKMRVKQLKNQPWCEICLENGVHTLATQVHHVERHEGDEHMFYNSPLQSLCISCHSKETAKEVKGRGAKKVSP